MGNSTAVESKPKLPAQETKVQDEELNEMSSGENTHFSLNKGYDFGFNKMNLYGSRQPGTGSLGIQTKLSINQPGDIYEQEADAMADKVMRMEMPDRAISSLPISQLQLKCEHCEKEEEDEKIQRKETHNTTIEPGSSLNSYVSGLNNSGQSLSKETRKYFEPRFGFDFSKVKIHHDEAAAESTTGIHAKAYTLGNNIVFNKGQYAPETESGKKLLGHELTHVVQQQSSLHPNRIQRLGFFESIGVFFGLAEGNYSDGELTEYLKKITTTKKIEDDYDSDNKARGIIRKWMAGNALFEITAEQMVLLIKEMNTGIVGDADESIILDILERSSDGDLRVIFGTGGITAKSLLKNFDGDEKKRLELFFDMRFTGGLAALEGGTVDPVPLSPKSKPVFPYNWNILKTKLDGPYSIEEITNDLNALTSADRDKALKDITAERTALDRKFKETRDKFDEEADPAKKTILENELKSVARARKKVENISHTLFKDIAIAETKVSLAAATRTPTAAERIEIAKALKPDLKSSIAGVALPFVEMLPGETKNYEEKLRDLTPGMIQDYFDSHVVNKGKTEHSDAGKVHELKEFERIGKASQEETDKVYGNYKTGPELKADIPATKSKKAVRGNIHDLWADMERNLKRMSAGEKKDLAIALVFYFFQTDDMVLNLNAEHNADPKFNKTGTPLNPEAKMQEKIVKEQTSNAAQIKKLNEIDRGWVATAGGGHINLQLFKKDTPEEDRAFLWDMFQTLIHEYLHTLVDSKYRDFAKTFGNTSNQFNTLIEGVDSMLAEIVWSNIEGRVNDPVLRAKIEGPLYSVLPPIKVRPPSMRRYESYSQAIKLVNIVGIRNLYAAYFLGDVDKIKT